MFRNRRKSSSVPNVPLSTLVAEGVEITGDIAFNGGVRIDGRVKGDLFGRTAEGQGPSLLVLSDKGRIEGSVRCGDAVINGTITGDVDVEHRLELQSDARVSGTIRYRELQMDVGASVTGHLVKAEAPGAADNVVELGEKTAAVASGQR
jgi:cytoskeletal protein CcmA (bactofilin family)